MILKRRAQTKISKIETARYFLMKIGTLATFDPLTPMMISKNEILRHLVVKISKIETAKYILMKINTLHKFGPMITMVMSIKMKIWRHLVVKIDFRRFDRSPPGQRPRTPRNRQSRPMHH